MTFKEIGELIVSLIVVVLLVIFMVSFVEWSKTWGWQMYGYGMFYSGLGIVLLSGTYAIASGMLRVFWKIFAEVLLGE